MSKSNNLTDFLTGIANKIRALTGETELIDPQDFEDRLDLVYQAGAEGASAELQEKSVSASTSEQTVRADEGYDGLSAVTVLPVTAEIDPALIPENIRSGVTVLGVNGTLDVQSAPEGDTVYYKFAELWLTY